MTVDSGNGLYGRYMDVLIEQVRSCHFASPTMLDRVEGAIRDRGTAEQYVEVLLGMLEEDRFPSPQLLERVSGLIYSLEATR